MSHLPEKICILTTTPLVVHFFLRPHLTALAEQFDVTLVCNPKNDTYLPPLELPVRQVAIDVERRISPLQDLRVLWQLFRLFRCEKFTLVVSVAPKAGLLGMMAAVFARTPHRVHIFQGEVWASRSGLVRLLLKKIDWLVARMTTRILAVSQSECSFLQTQGVTLPNQVQVLGSGSISGVDVQRFRADTLVRSQKRSELGIPDNAILCLFLGRITVDKGIFDLVRAFGISAQETPNLYLLLVGPDEAGVADLLHSLLDGGLGQRLVVLDYTDTPEDFFASADFLCLPSYREGFGMVVLEAAACGVPSIGSDIYGIQDAIVDNTTGLLFPPGDVQALSKALSSLSDNEELRLAMGRAAKNRVDKYFDSKEVVQRYVDFFKTLSDTP